MKRILIVEDDEYVSKALCVRLRGQGFLVITAFDAVEAMRAATEERPDVVVLDINLPGGSGLIVAERLLGQSVTTDLPTIFITAIDQARWRERAAELSAVAFLLKPFDAVELLDAIDLAASRAGMPPARSLTAREPRTVGDRSSKSPRNAQRCRARADALDYRHTDSSGETSMSERYRLVTRSDFDGLVCAVLLRHLDLIDDIAFVHPKDMQDGKIEITARDITTNLPYVPGAHLVFDHHDSETVRNDTDVANYIIDAAAPSAARVVWRHYGGHDVFPEAWDDMMHAVDKADSAQFSREEVLEPKGWELLNLLMDSRTGLGRFREFRISNYALMMELVEHCRTDTIETILALPDVVERVVLWESHREAFAEQLLRCSSVHGKLVVLDLTGEETIHPGSRFMIYALFPDCDISIHRMWGFRKQNVVFATGKSIFDRGNTTHVGELMLAYGGGGHAAAGTCQVAEEEAEATLRTLIETIASDSAAAGRLPIAAAG